MTNCGKHDSAWSETQQIPHPSPALQGRHNLKTAQTSTHYSHRFRRVDLVPKSVARVRTGTRLHPRSDPNDSRRWTGHRGQRSADCDVWGREPKQKSTAGWGTIPDGGPGGYHGATRVSPGLVVRRVRTGGCLQVANRSRPRNDARSD